MRLFVALYPPEDARLELRQWLVAALARQGRTARLGPVERWHLTLAFLGDVLDQDRPEVERAISRAIRSTRRAPRFRLAGGGTFGGRSSAVWAALDGDLTRLRELHAELRRALSAAGFRSDERPLTPHLTVSYRGDQDVLAALRDYSGPEWAATEIALVRSWFPRRQNYETLRTWPLAGAPAREESSQNRISCNSTPQDRDKEM